MNEPYLLRVTALVLILSASAPRAVGHAEPPKTVALSDAQKKDLRKAQIEKLKPLTSAKVNWDAVVAKLSANNVFRVLLKITRGNKKDPLSAGEQKLLAEYDADKTSIARISAQKARGENVSKEDLALLDKLKAKYAAQQNEVHEAVMAQAELTPAAKKVWTDSIVPHALFSPRAIALTPAAVAPKSVQKAP